MAKFVQGLYTPKYPEKYVGDMSKIRYRSSWELYFMNWLDNNTAITHWASEPFCIKYIKPFSTRKNQIHRYYPDFFIEYVDTFGKTHREVIEIKPKKHSKRSRSKNPTKKLQEDVTFAINKAKWFYAEQFCQAHGFVFKVINENDIYL